MEGIVPASLQAAVVRRDTLNLRIEPGDRGLIDRAALATGKTRTDFVLEAARRAAEDALAKPNERMRRSL